MKLSLVHLFVLLAHSCLMTQPSCVRDRNHDHRPRLSCPSMGLRDIPSSIDLNTQVLNFTHNQFSSLSWTSYKAFTELFELDLSHNQVNMLEQSSELVLPKLKILRLSGNQLKWLLPNAFTAAAHLMEIHLQGNKVLTLDATTFAGLAQLEILDLSQNYIQSLPVQLLFSIPSTILKTFDLEDNQITLMPNHFFESKPEIPYVYLSKNPWHCSCEIGYLSVWLNDQVGNVYIHEGPNAISNDPESVKCHSPSHLKDQPIIDLKESEYCSSPTEAFTQRSKHFGPGGDVLHSSSLTTQSNVWTIPNKDVSTAKPAVFSTMQSSLTTPSQPWTHAFTSTEFYKTVTQLYTWWFFNSTYVNDKITKSWWYISGPNSLMTTEGRYEANTSWWVSWVSTTTLPALAPSVTHSIHHLLSTSPTSSTGLGYERRDNRVGTEPAGVYCWWLFLGYLCLCIFFGLWLCAASLWLIHAYLRIYLPLLRSVRAKSNQLGYLALNQSAAEKSRENQEQIAVNRTGAISLPMEGVQAVFRSVLLVSVSDEGEDNSGAARSAEICQMDARVPGQQGGSWGEMESAVIKSRRETQVWEESGAKEDEVFRKTLYRVISQEGERSGWKDMQESWKHEKKLSREWKRKYSLILREEQVEAEQEEKNVSDRRPSNSRAEHVGHEWVVGEWEWKAEEGERGAPATGVDDHWSLMPLIARGTERPPANSDSTSETFL